MTDHNESMRELLYSVLANISSVDDAKNLCADLLTQAEMEQLSQRLYAAKLIIEGNTYNQIIAKTDISSATLSRVSSCVKNGKGYNKFLK